MRDNFNEVITDQRKITLMKERQLLWTDHPSKRDNSYELIIHQRETTLINWSFIKERQIWSSIKGHNSDIPVLYPLGIIVATLIPHALSSYLQTSVIVARADLEAQ